MQADIGIGVALQARGCALCAPRTARRDRRATKRCTSKPCPGAHVGQGTRARSGHGQVLGRRELAVGVAAGDQRHGQAGPFGDGRVVGEVERPAAAAASWAARMSAKRKPCGVCARHRPARSRVSATRPLARRPASGCRRAARRRWRPASAVEGLEHALDDVCGDTNGRTRVMDQHAVGRMRRQGPQAIEHRGCRVSPPVTGGSKLWDDRQMARRTARGRPAPITTCTRSTAGDPRKTPHGPRQHGDAPERGILLGRGRPGARAPSGGDDQRGGLQAGSSRVTARMTLSLRAPPCDNLAKGDCHAFALANGTGAG